MAIQQVFVDVVAIAALPWWDELPLHFSFSFLLISKQLNFTTFKGQFISTDHVSRTKHIAHFAVLQTRAHPAAPQHPQLWMRPHQRQSSALGSAGSRLPASPQPSIQRVAWNGSTARVRMLCFYFKQNRAGKYLFLPPLPQTKLSHHSGWT